MVVPDIVSRTCSSDGSKGPKGMKQNNITNYFHAAQTSAISAAPSLRKQKDCVIRKLKGKLRCMTHRAPLKETIMKRNIMTRDMKGMLRQEMKEVPRFFCEHAIIDEKQVETQKSDSGDKHRSFEGFGGKRDKQRGVEASQERLRDVSPKKTQFS